MAFEIRQPPTIGQSLAQGFQNALPGLVAGAQQRTFDAKELVQQQALQRLGQQFNVDTTGLNPQQATQFIGNAQQASLRPEVVPSAAKNQLTSINNEITRLKSLDQTPTVVNKIKTLENASFGITEQKLSQFEQEQAKIDELAAIPEDQRKPVETARLNQLTGRREQSQSALVGSLGRKIADGTATEREMGVFNTLTAKAGTEVTVNNISDLIPNTAEQLPALKGAQDAINKFKEDPANADILKDSDVNVVTNSKGQLQLEVKPKAAAGEGALKEFSDLVSLRDSARTAQILFEPSFVGFIEGSNVVGVVERATGLGTSPKEVSFKRIVNDLSDRLLRARSGAQINEQEFQRLTKIVPRLNTNEKVFNAELSSFMSELDAIIKTKSAISKQAGKRGLVDPSGTGRTPEQESRRQELLRKAAQ